MVSPPQNWAKMVLLMIFLMGKCKKRNNLMKKVPKFTSQFWFIVAKIQ
jgi:hypothetical protein